MERKTKMTKTSQSSGAILAQAMYPTGINRTPKNVSDAILAAENFQTNSAHAARIESDLPSITNELRRLADHFPKDNPERRVAKAFFGALEVTADLPETLAL